MSRSAALISPRSRPNEGVLRRSSRLPGKSPRLGVASAGPLQPDIIADNLAEIDFGVRIVAHLSVRDGKAIGPGYARDLPFLAVRRGYQSVFSDLEVVAAFYARCGGRYCDRRE